LLNKTINLLTNKSSLSYNKFLISPEIDPTWEERRKATPKILAEIRSRRHVNPADFGLPDSTELIREDRDR